MEITFDDNKRYTYADYLTWLDNKTRELLVCIVCDESKLDERGCLGAPDMVVEILSLSSQKYDLNEKFNLYEAAGVNEYWVVTPMEKGVTVFILQDNGRYDKGTVFEKETEVPVQTLSGLTLSTAQIFPK